MTSVASVCHAILVIVSMRVVHMGANCVRRAVAPIVMLGKFLNVNAGGVCAVPHDQFLGAVRLTAIALVARICAETAGFVMRVLPSVCVKIAEIVIALFVVLAKNVFVVQTVGVNVSMFADVKMGLLALLTAVTALALIHPVGMAVLVGHVLVVIVFANSIQILIVIVIFVMLGRSD
jgi:hypothetical protein